MRRLILALAVIGSLGLVGTVKAQETAPPAPLFQFEVGPGYLVSSSGTDETLVSAMDSTTSPLETYLGLVWNASDRFALGVRAEISKGRILTYGVLLRGYVTTGEGARTFAQLKLMPAGSDLEGEAGSIPVLIVFGGGAELPVADNVVGFTDVGGRYVPEIGNIDAILAGGIRIGWGRR